MERDALIELATNNDVTEEEIRNRLRMRRILFYSQLFISLLALGYAGAFIALSETSCETQAFVALFAGVVGYWLPQPTPS